jgi:LacI family transcriptional regulator
MMPKRVTLADVAREAGVSLMTVSRAVNNKDGISEATRQRIQSIAEQLGYRPSLVARSLVTDRTSTIGLVVIDNANPFFSEVARGVEHAAYDEGYNVFLCNTEEDVQRELDVLRSLEGQRVDGVLLCSSRLENDVLDDVLKNYPAVVLVNRILDNKEHGTVSIDDEYGAQLVIEHLLHSGHRAIGFVAGPERSYSGQLRAKRYRMSLESAGISPPPGWIRHCLPIVEAGREAAYDLLSTQPDLTALFCYNDLNAVGALQACAHLERRVPDDVAIVGFDDIPLAALVTPSLTTCHVPMYEMGQEATRLLIECINGCSEDQSHVTFQPELVIRESAP